MCSVSGVFDYGLIRMLFLFIFDVIFYLNWLFDVFFVWSCWVFRMFSELEFLWSGFG